MSRWREITAAIHVHSTFSDGRGNPDAIARAARAANLDAVILTDHNTMDARRAGFEGYIDGVLMLVGMEVSRARMPHVLALDVPNMDEEEIDPSTPPEIFKAIHEAGGMAIVAHPEGQRRIHFLLPAFVDWDNPDFDGVELWGYMHDWIEELRLWRLPAMVRAPLEHIGGPKASVMTGWDRACRKRRVVGVGALDVHAKRVPLTPWVVFPYEHTFKTVRTHVLVDDIAGRAERDIPALYEGLREGRCFVGYLPAGDARGFRFDLVTDDGERFPMGSELRYRPGATLEAEAPAEASIVLVRNGRLAARIEGNRMQRDVDTPGVYRVELRREGMPWIYSNPIYVR